MKNRVTCEYLPLPTNGQATHLKVEVYYSLGGYNVFTYRHEDRGYYLSVSPVNREEKDGYTMESFAAFSGTKILLYACKRKSDKSAGAALQIVDMYRDHLIRSVLASNNLPSPFSMMIDDELGVAK